MQRAKGLRGGPDAAAPASDEARRLVASETKENTQKKVLPQIPCYAAARPERWPHPAVTSWRRDEAARAGSSLPLPSASNLAPAPAAPCLPPVGLLLPGSLVVDPARGRVAGPPDSSTPAPTGSAPSLSPSCSPARDSPPISPLRILPQITDRL